MARGGCYRGLGGGRLPRQAVDCATDVSSPLLLYSWRRLGAGPEPALAFTGQWPVGSWSQWTAQGSPHWRSWQRVAGARSQEPGACNSTLPCPAFTEAAPAHDSQANTWANSRKRGCRGGTCPPARLTCGRRAGGRAGGRGWGSQWLLEVTVGGSRRQLGPWTGCPTQLMLLSCLQPATWAQGSPGRGGRLQGRRRGNRRRAGP